MSHRPPTIGLSTPEVYATRSLDDDKVAVPKVLTDGLRAVPCIRVMVHLADAAAPSRLGRLAREGSDGHQYLYSRRRGASPGLAMQRGLHRPELQHVAHHQHSSSERFAQPKRFEHRGQRRRARVVAVVDKHHVALETMDLSAPRSGLHGLHAFRRRLNVFARRRNDGERCQRVVRGVGSADA